MTTGRLDTRVPAMVLGSGVTALGVIRSLGLGRFPVHAVSVQPGLERYSRWYREAPDHLEPKRLAEFLDESRIERAVLIPCSDALANQVASLPDTLRERFPASIPDAPLLTSLIDKARLARTLEEHDIPHPQTLVVEEPTDLGRWEGSLGRAFVKPRDSQRFFARYRVKAIRPSGDGGGRHEEVSALIRKVLADGLGMVVQEYVPGPASNHYFIDGFVDRHGRVTGIFARRRLRMYPPWFGNSSAVKSVPRGEVSQAEADLLRLLEEVGYRGIFSAEFKRDERDGTFKLLEINARAWWYVEFATRAGVDVVSMAYHDALGNPVPLAGNYEIGRTLVYPYYDLFACLEARRTEGASLLRGLASWVGADHTIFARDDPGPFIWEAGRAARLFMTRRLPRRFRPPETVDISSDA